MSSCSTISRSAIPREILAELRAGKGAHAGTRDAWWSTLNDVTYDAYLANDRTLDDPQIVPVETGGRMRLRIINGAAASNMWIDLGRIVGQLIAVDGNPSSRSPDRVFRWRWLNAPTSG